MFPVVPKLFDSLPSIRMQGCLAAVLKDRAYALKIAWIFRCLTVYWGEWILYNQRLCKNGKVVPIC